MKVSLGYTRDVRTNKTEEWLGWVRYTNEGSTCLMSKTDVGVQAVTRTTHALLGQTSMSDAVGRMPFYLLHGESATAAVGLLVTFPKVAHSCVAEPIDSLEVLGYGYAWSSHFYSLSHWREPVLCARDRLAAFGGPLSPS